MRILCALVLALGISQTAFATTVVALSEPDLARAADAVIFGHVLAVRNVTVGQHAYTEASLEIIAAAHGLKPTDVITLRVPGGMTFNGLAQAVSGSPRLESGQLWVGYLVVSKGHYVPYGLSYGLLPVTRTRDGVYRASRQLPGLTLVAPSRAGLTQVESEPVDDLLARVRGYKHAADTAGPGQGVRQ